MLALIEQATHANAWQKTDFAYELRMERHDSGYRPVAPRTLSRWYVQPEKSPKIPNTSPTSRVYM
ncbi:MAG: hypothetical protein Tsb002_26830 [Wenzhouxiangellaceae bacterium]